MFAAPRQGGTIVAQPRRRAFVDAARRVGSPLRADRARPTETALDEAEALGVQAGQVAKTIILTTSDGFVRAVLPASRRLDLDKVRDLLEDDAVSSWRASTCSRRRYPDFELGAVPPFGGSPTTACSSTGGSVAGKTVVIEAGTHDESVRLRTRISCADGRAARRPLPRLPGSSRRRGRFAGLQSRLPRRRSSAGRALHS